VELVAKGSQNRAGPSSIVPVTQPPVDPPPHPDGLQDLPWIAASNFYRDEVVLTHATTGETRRLPIRPRLTTDNMYAQRNAAALGVGVTIGSTWALREQLDRGELVQLVPEWQAPTLPIWLIYPPARFYPARLRRFIEIMRVAVPGAFGIEAPE